MLVFRFENREEQGVYARGYGHKCSANGMFYDENGQDAPDCSLHVGPQEDPALKAWWEGERLSKKARYQWMADRTSWYCGFSSKEEMMAWFPKEGIEKMIAMRDRLKDTMSLCLYEVKASKVKQGAAQVLFHMPSAQFIERLSLEEVLKMAN